MTFRFAALYGSFLLGLSTFAPPGVLSTPALAQNVYQPLPLEEYGKLPDVERVAMSPSGDRIAVLTTMNGKRVLLAIEDQSKALTAIELADQKIRSVRWIGEDRLLMVSSQTESLGYGFTTDKAELFYAEVIAIDPSEEAGVVFGNSAQHPDVIIGNYGVRQIDGTYYGFFGGIELQRGRAGRIAGYQLDHARPYLFRVNLENMDIKKVSNAAPEGYGSDWLIDAQGDIAFKLSVNYSTGAWEIRSKNGDKIIEGQQPRAGINLVGLGYAGDTLIYVERGEDASDWYEVGQTGGKPKPLFGGDEFESLFFDRNGHLMGYTIGTDENERHVFADQDYQKKMEDVRKAFSAFETSLAGWANNLDDMIVRTSGNGDSGTYYAVDLASGKANAIAYQRMAITPDHVGKISTFKYTARDGMEMDGILTLPPGREPEDLPVILFPHGGPQSADTPAFDWWAQAFASRGYAVFQPNFRGSTNRDVTFQRAGYGEWGRKMQTDKTDGLKALAETGMVDPERACIIGGSYGGYAALAGVTVQQGLFRCAVAFAPVSDIRDMYNEDVRTSGRNRTTRVALREQLGDPSLWDAVSPQKLADRADAPILLIHGRDDVVVPYHHSTRMADKLKDAGKPYRLVTLDGEDHWLSLSETRQRMLSEAVAFVEQHNPATVTAPSPGAADGEAE